MKAKLDEKTAETDRFSSQLREQKATYEAKLDDKISELTTQDAERDTLRLDLATSQNLISSKESKLVSVSIDLATTRVDLEAYLVGEDDLFEIRKKALLQMRKFNMPIAHSINEALLVRVEGAIVQLKEGRSRTRGRPFVSENLIDSLVDFKLRELASIGAGPSRFANSSAEHEELLEISRGFSDCSSFGSDISGELQRLASFSISEVPRSVVASNVEGFEESGLSTSSESLEYASVEGVEPVVRVCVERLRSVSVEAKREAAARIRLLAKHRSDFRSLIGASGAISALVLLLRSTDPAAQENEATALLNLSLEEANKRCIVAAGAIKPLVYTLRTGTASAKQNAACTLLNISMIEENRATIGACGAIPPFACYLIYIEKKFNSHLVHMLVIACVLWS
ncbi:vacuolar protein 8-like [Zingiber officinale]|uniref:vacuolar protein 8-like n=1 Tax=Zingiber officinale TaxID=94328 RepID=UPI001C4AA4B8|nr:vacuolar protein 8-like [Zingiber officinale]